MKYLLRGATICTGDDSAKKDILIEDGIVTIIEEQIGEVSDAKVFSLDGFFIFPGFTDVHVHLREPGFSYKETIRTGTEAGAHGGYTKLCAMPNLDPVPDSAEHLQKQLDIIKRDAVISVFPYASITKNEMGQELADMEEIAPEVIAFSDDGHGVQNEDMMREAMIKARKLGKLIVAHCEDNSLLNGGYIHDGAYARAHGHRGICSESEWKQIERDLKLAEETGCGYHVCHISTKESVQIIRQAKKNGVDVTCETAPHYLVLTEEDLIEDGRFKMNPPLRTREDREELRKGLLDGTIDAIATDHAPHSAEEKAKGLKGSAMGIVGLETAFPVLYTNLVETGILPLQKLIELLTVRPEKRFGILGGIRIGQPADLTVFDLNESFLIDPEEFYSKGRSTPFAGNSVKGRCLMTFAEGEMVYSRDRGILPDLDNRD